MTKEEVGKKIESVVSKMTDWPEIMTGCREMADRREFWVIMITVYFINGVVLLANVFGIGPFGILISLALTGTTIIVIGSVGRGAVTEEETNVVDFNPKAPEEPAIKRPVVRKATSEKDFEPDRG